MPSPGVLASAVRSCWRSSRQARSALSPAPSGLVSPLSHSPFRHSTARQSFGAPVASVFSRSFASAALSASLPTSEGTAAVAEVNEQAAVEHFLSSLPSSLAELAPKFTSWAHLLHASSRQLKALGLTVKQRKSLLYHTELYKARQRRREMLHYLAQPANREQSAVAVQQALYDLAYSHVYARQWKRAEEREAEQWWRKATEMNRLRKTFIRNQWNGVQVPTNPESMKPLRNPELMKEKLQAELDNLREMQADGSGKLLDQLDLLEHEQLQDENERADMEEMVEERLQELAADEELREDIKAHISKARQSGLLDTRTEADEEEQRQTDQLTRELQLRSLLDESEKQLQQEADEQDDEDEDELSQEEQDSRNPHMEDGMNEEQKEDARLELAVDRAIFSDEVRGAVLADMELALLDFDADEPLGMDDERAVYETDELSVEKAAADAESASSSGNVTAPAPVPADAQVVSEAAQRDQNKQAVAQRAQERRQHRTSISKLFSYNGRKSE